MKEQTEILAAKITGLQKTLDLLDHKIGVYEKAVLATERKLAQAELS